MNPSPQNFDDSCVKELMATQIKIEDFWPSGDIASTTVIHDEIDPAIVTCFAESAFKALSQYCIGAIAGEMIDDDDLTGDFSSRITLTDEKSGIQIVIVLVFPKPAACQIYENIFGKVEIENVPGVVHELGNILTGLAKVKLTKLQSEVFKTVYPEKQNTTDNSLCLNFQIGLPEVSMDTNRVHERQQDNIPKFTLPLNLQFGKCDLLVSFHKIGIPNFFVESPVYVSGSKLE